VKKDQIVNWKSRKNCEVQLNFHRGEDEYTVYRGLKPDKLIVSKNGSDLPIDAKKLDFQAQFEENVLGIDFKTFMSLVYTNINTTAPILTMRKPEKRLFLERVFGLQFIKVINDGANQKVKSINEKVNEFAIQKEYNIKTAKAARDQIVELEKKLRSYGTSRPKLNEEKEKLKDVSELVQDAEDTYHEKNGEIGSLEGKLQYYDFLITRIGTKEGNLRTRVKTLGQQLPTLTGLEKDLSRLKTLEDDVSKYVDIDTIENNINEKKTEQEALADRYSEVVDEIRGVELKMASIDSLISQDLDSAKELEQVKICPTCGKKVGATVIQKFRVAANEKQKKLVKLEEMRILSQNRLIGIEKKQNTENEVLKGLVDDKNDVMKLDAEIKSLLHIREKVGRKDIIKKDIKKFGRVLKKLEIAQIKIVKKAEKVGIKATLLEEEVTAAKEIIDNYNNIVAEIEHLEERIKLEEKYRSELKGIIDKNTATIVKAELSNEEGEKKRTKLLHLNDYLQYIRKVCKDEHIKQYAISANVPYLNKKTNEYLAEVGHGFFVVLDKWLDLQIKGPGISGAGYGNLSGGEARGIDLALQLALLDFARGKAGVFPDILELDELLDSSIDSYGLKKVMQIVRLKQQQDKLKVFLVSHRKEVNDVSADRTILIEKVGGYSNIVLQ
jgi:DNA repair exonuclease SbcCD ATPase subunit